MLKFLNFWTKWEIHFLTPLWIFAALMSGQAKFIFMNYFLAFIHELGHILMASVLNVKVEKIEWLPFGFFAQIPTMERIHFLKEFSIIIAGPLMFILNDRILLYFSSIGLISHFSLNKANEFNQILLVFNLIPLIPLDGSRLLHWSLSFLLPERLSLWVTGLISASTLGILFLKTDIASSWLISFFLLSNQVEYFFKIPTQYLSFLLDRIHGNPYKSTIIHQQLDLYRHFNNIIINSKKIWPEKTFVLKIIAKSVKKINI